MNLAWALVGKPQKIKKIVVLSPIFYPSHFGLRSIKLKSGNVVGYHRKYTFIKTYPAPNWVYDTVIALKDTSCETVIYVGTAAGINPDLRCGQIVSSDSLVKIKSIKSFWQETGHEISKWRRQGYDAIDFELESFLSGCRKIGCQPKFFLLVEDLLPDKPFYKISSRDRKIIEEGMQKLITLCKTFAQNL